MATTEKETAYNGEEYVDFEAFYDGDKYKDDILVIVNGDRCQIKRGEKVKIKRKFLDVIKASEEQDRQTARMCDRLASEFDSESRKY
jgi:phosphopantothenoylcysteine synthetase/decarboxylase